MSYARTALRRPAAVAVFSAVIGLAAAFAATGQASAASFGEPAVYVGNGNGTTVETGPDAIVDLAERRGRLPVIVRMRMDFAPEGAAESFQAASQRAAIGNLQRRIVARVPGERNLKRFETVPFVAMLVDPAGLRALLDDPDVAAITEDVPVPLTLNQSVPLIRADRVSKSRKVNGGKGWAVAVLDTGVQLDHPALKGKTVSEACYSTDYPPYSRSVCPGGVQQSTEPGSGTYCDSEECFHGTHVAGIAVGNPKGKYKGVATQADLVPIQVFSEFVDEDYCDPFPAPCYESFTSDQMLALERVVALNGLLGQKPRIASVNMSIGGGRYRKACDGNELAPLVATLTKKKIAVVIASGNDGWNRFVNSPGCISKAVTVGSTTKSDAVSFFSNQSPLVDVMAPGSEITSAIPVDAYAAYSGTSMATPHVAGTWALLRKFRPNAGVGKILKALKCSGKDVSRNGLVKPRINVLAAKRALARGC